MNELEQLRKEFNELRDLVVVLENQIGRNHAIAALQAIFDAKMLEAKMLECCHEDMSSEQLAEYERHCRPVNITVQYGAKHE